MRPLSVQDYLPRRIVVAREFIGEDGKPRGAFSGPRRLPAFISGGGGVSGDEEGDEKYEIIERFLEIKGERKPYTILRLNGEVDSPVS